MATVAITGVNGYFAKTVLPLLQADPDVDAIVGIDIAPWKSHYSKVTFRRHDVCDKGLGNHLRGVDILLHLAFIVEEIHNKRKTHRINVEGSKNVFEAAAQQGVRKVIYTSSLAAYGAHPDNPIGITEEYPLVENPDSYYSSDKVAVERFLHGFINDHPEMMFTIFRPPVIVGPNLTNFAARLITRKVGFFLKGRDPKVQFLHEDDLGRALHLAIQKDFPGIYNITTDDYTSTRRVYALSGTKLFEFPPSLLRVFSNLLFALRVEKISQGWISLLEYSIVASNAKFKNASGWQPLYGSEEAIVDFLRSRSRT